MLLCRHGRGEQWHSGYCIGPRTQKKKFDSWAMLTRVASDIGTHPGHTLHQAALTSLVKYVLTTPKTNKALVDVRGGLTQDYYTDINLIMSINPEYL